jgi:hypothetical protein
VSSLLETQREFARLIMQPMTSREGIPTRSRAAAEKFIKPNDRLTSLERLEIYNRSYWFRILDCLAEDFPGVRAIMGVKRFRRMSEAYLAECPSRSFTLRNLGLRLGEWLKANPKWGRESQLLPDMVALEWAHIEAFDGAQRPPVTQEQLAQAGAELRLQLQPYIQLLALHYPVDDLLIAVREGKRTNKMVAEMLRSPADIYLALHRFDYSVHYRRLEPEAYQLLSSLRDGTTLMDAIEAAFAASTMTEEQQAQRAQEWFGLWQSLGWFSSTPANAKSSFDGGPSRAAQRAAKEIRERLE